MPQHACSHEDLILDTSPFADETGFTRIPWERRLASATPSSRALTKPQLAGAESEHTIAQVFPGPLVLKGDDLALDPKCPPQTLRAFCQLPERNRITKRRQTIYVAAPPEIDVDVSFVNRWRLPVGKKPSNPGPVLPMVEDIKEYLAAFYHGLEVANFPTQLRLVRWDEEKKSRKKETLSALGLQAGNSVTRIRARPCPDGVFSTQLNLSDVLDAAIEMVPTDAYAIILLTHEDLYEDDDDDFCCGRAYGGSRVCVVSTARYHPALDVNIGIDLAHAWPASHCKSYVDSILGLKPSGKPPKQSLGPLRAAVDAAHVAADPTNLYGIWLSRVCRTTSHELGHCIGIGHCVHFACVMQGTSGLVEDARQPPYLCPICMAKLSRAIAFEFKGTSEVEYVQGRHRAMLGVCGRWGGVGMFDGLAAWIKAQIE